MSDFDIIYGHKIKLPPCPPDEEVINYGLPEEDQMWVREELPSYFERVEYNKP